MHTGKHEQLALGIRVEAGLGWKLFAGFLPSSENGLTSEHLVVPNRAVFNRHGEWRTSEKPVAHCS